MAGEELLSECRSGWLTVESDFSAKLSKPEQLKHALQCVGRNPSPRSVERYWSQCGGAMSFQQFQQVMRRERKTAMADLLSAFKRIDLNGDGYITAEELLRLLTKRGDRMTREEAQDIIDEADRNGDGKLDYAEFCHMIVTVSEDCLKATQIRADKVLRQTPDARSSRIGRSSSKASGRSQKVIERSERKRVEFREQLFPLNTLDLSSQTSPPSNDPNTPTPSVNGIQATQPIAVPETNASGEKSKSGRKHKKKGLKSKAKKDSDILSNPLEAPSSLSSLPPLSTSARPTLTAPFLPPLEDHLTGSSRPANSHHLGGAVKEEHNSSGKTSEEPATPNSAATATEAEVPEEDISQPSEGDSSSSPHPPPASVPGEGSIPRPQPEEQASHATGSRQDEASKATEDRQRLLPAAAAAATAEKQPGHLLTPSPPPPPLAAAAAAATSEGVSSPPCSVVPPAPRKPHTIQSWNSITGKGCFYLEMTEDGPEVGVVKCHHYRLVLPTATNVWIEVGVASPGNQATDVLLFVFRTDSSDEPTDFIAYTQHRVNERWVCRLDLDPGTYALVPFTTGCLLKPCEDGDGVRVVSGEGGGEVELTAECRSALEEVFHRMDLDGNGNLCRAEFDFFQEKTTGEICDDETWKVIQDNFAMTSEDELTLAGFLQLHVMTARDEEGGGAEVWQVLSSLGYHRVEEGGGETDLELLTACPFALEVFTEECEGEIEIVDLLPCDSLVDPVLTRLVVEMGVASDVVNGRGEIFIHTYTTPHITTVVLENKGAKKTLVQVDCSRSGNFVFSQESPVQVLELDAHSSTIAYHLQAADRSLGHDFVCTASRILS